MQCPAGKFGNHPLRSLCFDCQPGYVCLQGAAIGNPDVNLGFFNLTVNGALYPNDLCSPYDGIGANATVTGYPSTLSYQCPPGYYCPIQSGAPIPCPKGTYRPDPLGVALSDFTPCPANKFNPNTGQKTCQSSGPSSQSGVGASTCTCIGKNRAFSQTGKQCICKPLYAAREGATLMRGSLDGTTDCQQLVFDNCPEQSTRNMAGDCLSQSQWYSYCLSKCPSGLASPYYQPELGVCLCLAVPLESVCDTNCQKQEQGLQSIVCNNPTVLAVENPTTGATIELDTSVAFGGLYDIGTVV